MELFSKNLTVLRTVWNVSQLELARKFGVVGPSYSRWENGTEPKYETLVEIAKYFKISIDRLLTEELTPQSVPPRWGGKDYAQPELQGSDEAHDAEQAEGEWGEVAKLLGKVMNRMDEIEAQQQKLREEWQRSKE